MEIKEEMTLLMVKKQLNHFRFKKITKEKAKKSIRMVESA
jgi:hypothetical protein